MSDQVWVRYHCLLFRRKNFDCDLQIFTALEHIELKNTLSLEKWQ